MTRSETDTAKAEGRAAGYAFKGNEAYSEGRPWMGRYWIARALEESREAGLCRCMTIVFEGVVP